MRTFFRGIVPATRISRNSTAVTSFISWDSMPMASATETQAL